MFQTERYGINTHQAIQWAQPVSCQPNQRDCIQSHTYIFTSETKKKQKQQHNFQRPDTIVLRLCWDARRVLAHGFVHRTEPIPFLSLARSLNLTWCFTFTFAVPLHACSLSLCVWWCDDGLNDGTYIRSPTATLDKFALHVHTASRRHWTFRHSTLGVCFKSSGARLWQTIDRWRTYLLVIWCRPKRQSSLYHSLTKSSHCSLLSNNIYSEGWFGAEPQLITDWPPF